MTPSTAGRRRYPLAGAGPINAIELMMEQKGLARSDLASALGRSGRVSEVLNRRRPRSINMIRVLVELLDVPADLLVRPYRVMNDAGSTSPGAGAGRVAKRTRGAGPGTTRAALPAVKRELGIKR